MHPIRKQRMQIVILIVVAATLAGGLLAYMLGQNANYFYTPSQMVNGEAPRDVTIRVGGMWLKIRSIDQRIPSMLALG